MNQSEPGNCTPSGIVHRHSDHLVNVVRRNMPARLRRRLDPEDVVQSVFRSFFRRQDDGRLVVDPDHEVGRLLVTMTLNKVRNAIAFHQRQCRDMRRERDGVENITADSPLGRQWSPEHELQLAELLDRLLDGLPEVHREIVLLRMVGQTVAEIARSVKRSERTVIRVLSCLEHQAREEPT